MQSVKEEFITGAISALVNFCRSHTVELWPNTIKEFAEAWRRGGSFEFTPCAMELRRIWAISPDSQGRIALVFNYEGRSGSDLDEPLTKELNESIRKTNSGRWPTLRD